MPISPVARERMNGALSDRLLGFLGNNVASVGNADPAVSRASNPLTSPLYQGLSAQTESVVPQSTLPQTRVFTPPTMPNQDLIDSLRSQALGLTGNDSQPMFQSGDTVGNIGRGLAGLLHIASQAAMQRQLTGGQRYFQPGSGRVINSSGIDMGDAMRLQMSQQQDQQKNSLARLMTAAKIMESLSRVQGADETAYHNNAAGNMEAIKGRLQPLASTGAQFKDLESGAASQASADQRLNAIDREQELRPHDIAEKDSLIAQHDASARASNTGADWNVTRNERDQALAPIDLKTHEYNRDIAGSKAKDATIPFSKRHPGGNKKTPGEAMDVTEAGGLGKQASKLETDIGAIDAVLPKEEPTETSWLGNPKPSTKTFIYVASDGKKESGSYQELKAARDAKQAQLDTIRGRGKALRGPDPAGAQDANANVAETAALMKERKPELTDDQALSLAQEYLAQKKK